MRKATLVIAVITLSLLSFGMLAYAIDLRDVTFNTKNAGKVKFSHNNHINQKAMANNCNACHDAIYSMKKKSHYTMADMDKGKSCGACHDAKKAFSVKDCVRCHQVKEVTFSVKSTGATRFSHNKHLAKSSNCAVCHPSLFSTSKSQRYTMSDMEKGKSCGACHNGTKAFSISKCAACHPTKNQIYSIKGAGNVTFSHANHTKHYNCSSCHTKVYSTAKAKAKVSMKAMESGSSCGACHNGKLAFSVKANCATCHKTK